MEQAWTEVNDLNTARASEEELGINSYAALAFGGFTPAIKQLLQKIGMEQVGQS
jgi:hypothetical protein